MKDTGTRTEGMGIRDQKVIRALGAGAHTQLQSVGRLGSGDEMQSDMGYVGKLSFLKEREDWDMGSGILGGIWDEGLWDQGVVGVGWDCGDMGDDGRG